jgi:uncharacterized protein
VLQCISLGVANLADASAFYTQWGWVVLKQTPHYTHFKASNDSTGMVLALYPLASLQAVFGGNTPLQTHGNTSSLLSVLYNDPATVLTTYDTLIALGASVISKPAAQSWGRYAGFLSDLDGHPWELHSELP